VVRKLPLANLAFGFLVFAPEMVVLLGQLGGELSKLFDILTPKRKEGERWDEGGGGWPVQRRGLTSLDSALRWSSRFSSSRRPFSARIACTSACSTSILRA
jgi:hypothetical protein